MTEQDMMRELHFYAMEEMRNRGIEAAARAIEDMGFNAAVTDRVRALKRDPSAHLSDWWGNKNTPLGPVIDFVPIGA